MQENNFDIKTEAFSNEMKLLLLCSIKDMSGEQQEKVRSMMEGETDWELFLKLIRKHRVYPIVYYNLRKIEGIEIHAKVLNTLEQRCQKNLMKSMKLTAELIRISRLLDENGIRTFSLKGPILAMSIYGEMALRNTRDLDLLIAEHEVEKAERLLLEIGYKSIELDDEEALTPKRKRNSIRTKHHFAYQNTAGIIVEVHWRYSYQFSEAQFDKLWKNRREQIVSGHKIAVLAPEDEFIFLVIHGARHGWTRLRWLCDIAEIIKQDRLQWDETIKIARAMNAMDMLVQAVILANKLYDTEIPDILSAPLAGNKVGRQMAQMALPLITEMDEKATEPGQPLYMYLKKYDYIRSKGLKRKLSYLATMIYPQTVDYQTVYFSDRFFFMYYMARPFFKIQRMIRK